MRLTLSYQSLNPLTCAVRFQKSASVVAQRRRERPISFNFLADTGKTATRSEFGWERRQRAENGMVTNGNPGEDAPEPCVVERWRECTVYCASLVHNRDPEPFEWYQRYSGIKDVVNQHIRKASSILNIGAGNSRAFVIRCRRLLRTKPFPIHTTCLDKPSQACRRTCTTMVRAALSSIDTCGVNFASFLLAGYRDITNIDISGTVVDMMAERHRDKAGLSCASSRAHLTLLHICICSPAVAAFFQGTAWTRWNWTSRMRRLTL